MTSQRVSQLFRKILAGIAWIISILVIVITMSGYPAYAEYEIVIAWIAIILIPIIEYLFWKGVL